MLDLAIIGGGPAGLTAGLYATRGGLKDVIMFEVGMPGGQITQSSEIENYPGVIEVVTGMELMQDWPKQCGRFGLKTEMASYSFPLPVVKTATEPSISQPGAGKSMMPSVSSPAPEAYPDGRASRVKNSSSVVA